MFGKKWIRRFFLLCCLTLCMMAVPALAFAADGDAQQGADAQTPAATQVEKDTQTGENKPSGQAGQIDTANQDAADGQDGQAAAADQAKAGQTLSGETSDNAADSVNGTPANRSPEAGDENWTPVYKGVDYSPVFDADYYLSHHADVRAAFGTDKDKAFDHFIRCGMKEGRQACETFNVFAYANRHEDLQKAFRNDLPAYYSHYLRCGYREGRDGSPFTDAADAEKNSSIRFDWANETKNGKDYSLIFNAVYYLNKYPDVKAAYGSDQQKAFDHFLRCGMKEGRQGCASFNVFAYANRHEDLQKAFKSDLPAYYSHYLRCGYSEGRDGSPYTDEADLDKNTGLRFSCVNMVVRGLDYSLVFDPDYYLKHNSDVLAAFGYDEQAAFDHFLNYGMKEGRQGCESFNVLAYANRYKDVQNAFHGNLPAYYSHYIRCGYHEGRDGSAFTDESDLDKNTGLRFDWVNLVSGGIDYSPVFDMDYYMSHYRDLVNRYHFDKQKYFDHFLKYGMNEGRRANETFNVFAYANRYKDLQRAYQGSLPKYYRHYLQYGIHEKQSGADYSGSDARNSRLCFPLKSADQLQMDRIAHGNGSNTAYLILVDRKSNHLGIYKGAYHAWATVKYFSVSTGAPRTPTPSGTYQVGEKGFSFGSGYTCYYWTGFIGHSYLFHSIIYNQGTWRVQDGRLGVNISHGCVRMAVENAKWIYDHIPVGTTVIIY